MSKTQALSILQAMPTGLFIDNQFVSSNKTLVTINPATAETLCEVAHADNSHIDQALSSAQRALTSTNWGEITPAARANLLFKLAELIRDHKEQLALIEVLDTGKPITFARAMVDSTARYFEFYAGYCDKFTGESIPAGAGYVNYTQVEPIGVSLQILPWNVPLNMFARGVAPALAAGCAVIVKPAPQTPLGALQLAKLIQQANFPKGVLSVLTGGNEVGALLCADPRIDSITFTGSVATGKKVMATAATNLTPVILELGGKSPIVVFDDANVENVAQGVAAGIYSNTGQFCDAGSRLICTDKLHDQVIEQLLAVSKQYNVADPFTDPKMGPLISLEQQQKVLGYIETGKSSQANLCLDGSNLSKKLAPGYFVGPTIFAEVNASDQIAQEEIFGPVLSVIRSNDESEAIKFANDSVFGLSAGVYTNNLTRAMRMVNHIDAGTIYVNEYYGGADINSPFGGFKHSGIGTERGKYGIYNYLRVKNIVYSIS